MVALSGYLAWGLMGPKQHFALPGKTTHGHYQIELDCTACHDAQGGFDPMSCNRCHADELEHDSHPAKKFKDPRNADMVADFNAMDCVTCHKEHVPHQTTEMAVTVAGDFCFRCHEDIAEERPTHAGISFTTCSDAGCHNYHDNTALYYEFLLKHKDASPHLGTDHAQRVLRPADALYAKMSASLPSLNAEQADAPMDLPNRSAAVREWLGTPHALNGVNCTDCHQTEKEAWIAKPSPQQCATCHDYEVSGWQAGMHGMRTAQGLSPMTPGMAEYHRMHANSAHAALSCVSCHGES